MKKNKKKRALCHDLGAKPKLCATKPKQIIQEFGTSRITQKAQLFAAFVSLQGKTMFIWQIKVAKTAKAKLCATTKALCHNSKQIIQEFGTSRILVLLHKAIGKTWVSRRESKALCHNTKANYPRIRHKPNNAKSYAFCSFCVFAGKNAVYLANQSCKDGKSKALRYKARHRGSRGTPLVGVRLLRKENAPHF